MERNDTVTNALEAACEFNDRKLWKRFTNYDCFGVRIAGQDELMLGVVLGNAGEEYGLSLLRGPRAAAALAALMNSEGADDDSLDDMDMLGFSMETFGSLPSNVQEWLHEAGQRPGCREQVPHFLAKPQGHRTRLPNESELALLELVLWAVVKADRSKLLQPTTLEDDTGICVIHMSGDATESGVNVTREKVAQEEGPTTIPLLPTSHDLRGLPGLETTWLAGMPALPAEIEGDDRAMQLLLIMDDTSELVLQGRPVFSGDLKEAADSVVETFCGKGIAPIKGLPRRIIFSSRKLHDAMKPTLEPLGVQCAYKPTIPKLQQMVEEFYNLVDTDLAPSDEYLEAVGSEDMQTPAPNDLKGWKEVHQRLFRRFVEHFEREDRLWSSRAVKRYFRDDDLEYYAQEYEHQGVLAAYTAWGILDYRPNKTSKTHAEKMLKKGLSEPEGILLRAMMEACPTLQRVAGHDPKAGTVDLEDVLLGGTVTTHDQLMSENIDNGVFFAARAFPAGRFHFIEMAGPPLGPGMGMEAVEFLRRSKMRFTPEGLRRDAHKFGWLWQWIDEWEANRRPPCVCNSDGDELLWHTASFSVANADQTRRTLMQREDIDYDDQEDELVWKKCAGGDTRVLGETVTLGRMEFVGDELVLTVNSAKRFATARKWLEKLPGVAFRSVQTRRWDEAEEDRPMDERISPPEPLEMTPELASSVQEMMDKHYMGWLDTPLPALGGKTPRQACRTEAGRQDVTMLIRTMPDPAGPDPIQVPREVMMRELGLNKGATSLPPASRRKPHAPIPVHGIGPKPKVARNAPCPCGSGRKYTKCCGRQRNG